jgi:hypothetical protein
MRAVFVMLFDTLAIAWRLRVSKKHELRRLDRSAAVDPAAIDLPTPKRRLRAATNYEIEATTRRFLARPAAVALDTTGLALPLPVAVTLTPDMCSAFSSCFK